MKDATGREREGKRGCNVFRVDSRLIRNNLRSSLGLQASERRGGEEKLEMGLRRQERKAFPLLNNLRRLSEIMDVSASWDLHRNLSENLHAIHV